MGYGMYDQQATKAVRTQTENPAESGRAATAVGSHAAIYFDIDQCLVRTETELNLRTPWRTCNADQAWLMERRDEIRIGDLQCLKTDAEFTQDWEVARDFFLRHDMSDLAAQFTEPLPPDNYVACAYDAVTSTWDVQGKRKPIRVPVGEEDFGPAEMYEGAEFEGVMVFSRIPNRKGGIASMTAGELTYFFLVGDEDLTALKGTALFSAVKERLSERVMAEGQRKQTLHFPIIDGQFASDVSWLKDMRTTTVHGQVCKIVRAGQCVKLRVNHRGAKVEVAAFVQSALECMAMGLTITKTFVIALVDHTRNDQLLGVFVASPDTWVNPGTHEAKKLDEEDAEAAAKEKATGDELFFLMIRRPPRSTLFPYTARFRSRLR